MLLQVVALLQGLRALALAAVRVQVAPVLLAQYQLPEHLGRYQPEHSKRFRLAVPLLDRGGAVLLPDFERHALGLAQNSHLPNSKRVIGAFHFQANHGIRAFCNTSTHRTRKRREVSQRYLGSGSSPSRRPNGSRPRSSSVWRGARSSAPKKMSSWRFCSENDAFAGVHDEKLLEFIDEVRKRLSKHTTHPQVPAVVYVHRN